MTCNELIKTLKDLDRPDSPLFFQPLDGKGGLYQISGVRRVAAGGNLPKATLSSSGSMDPLRPLRSKELQDALRQMPEQSQVVYDDSHEAHQTKFVDVISARLLERRDLDARGFGEATAPGIMLSARH